MVVLNLLSATPTPSSMPIKFVIVADLFLRFLCFFGYPHKHYMYAPWVNIKNLIFNYRVNVWKELIKIHWTVYIYVHRIYYKVSTCALVYIDNTFRVCIVTSVNEICILSENNNNLMSEKNRRFKNLMNKFLSNYQNMKLLPIHQIKQTIMHYLKIFWNFLIDITFDFFFSIVY